MEAIPHVNGIIKFLVQYEVDHESGATITAEPDYNNALTLTTAQFQVMARYIAIMGLNNYELKQVND